MPARGSVASGAKPMVSKVIDMKKWLKGRQASGSGQGLQDRDADMIRKSDNLQFFLNGEEFPSIRFAIEGKGYELCNDGNIYEIDLEDI